MQIKSSVLSFIALTLVVGCTLGGGTGGTGGRYGRVLSGEGAVPEMVTEMDQSGALMRVEREATSKPYYRGFESNEFIKVSDKAKSTFSIDVDTASYSNSRRFLLEGNRPPKDAVRVEEFINYFDYSYSEPKSGKKFSISYELAPAPQDEKLTLLRIGVASEEDANTPPWNLVFLVDVSGSMSPDNRLPLVKRALKLLVNKMRDKDRVAIVTYAGTVGVALESTSVSDKEDILEAIKELGAGGNTFGSGGIDKAYKIAGENFIKNGVNRIVLATDGDFNVGVTNNDELEKLIIEKRKSGIFLTTVGVGDDNFKDGMLEQLADKGNGNYFYLDGYTEAKKIFSHGLIANVVPVAKDVKIQMEFDPQTVKSYRLLGYENRRLRDQDFKNDKVDAGETGSGQHVTVLYELKLKEQPSKKVGVLNIRYKEPSEKSSSLESTTISTSKMHDAFDDAGVDFRFAAAVANFGYLLRDEEQLSCKKIEKIAGAAVGSDDEGYRAEFVKLVRKACGIEKAEDSQDEDE